MIDGLPLFICAARRALENAFLGKERDDSAIFRSKFKRFSGYEGGGCEQHPRLHPFSNLLSRINNKFIISQPGKEWKKRFRRPRSRCKINLIETKN